MKNVIKKSLINDIKILIWFSFENSFIESKSKINLNCVDKLNLMTVNELISLKCYFLELNNEHCFLEIKKNHHKELSSVEKIQSRYIALLFIVFIFIAGIFFSLYDEGIIILSSSNNDIKLEINDAYKHIVMNFLFYLITLTSSIFRVISLLNEYIPSYVLKEYRSKFLIYVTIWPFSVLFIFNLLERAKDPDQTLSMLLFFFASGWGVVTLFEVVFNLFFNFEKLISKKIKSITPSD